MFHASAFLARHVFFVVFCILTACLLWTLLYSILLVLSLCAGQGPGGPLAYPGGLIAIVLACAVFGWGIAAPASAAGALLCAVLRLPRLAAIPLVFTSAFALSCLLWWLWTEIATTRSMPRLGQAARFFLLYLSIPLGVYWWLTEGPGALFDALRRRLANIHKTP